HAQLVDTDTKSDPEEALSKTEESHLLGSKVPLIGEEFKAVEPSGTRTDSSHSSASLDFTAPLSPDHPLTHVSPTLTPTRASFHCRTIRMTMRAQPAMSPGLLASVIEAMALYRGTSELILDTDSEGDELVEDDTDKGREDESLDVDDEREGLDDEGCGLGDDDLDLESERLGLKGSKEEVVHEGQQRAAPVGDTVVDPEDGQVYTNIPAYAPPDVSVQTSPSLEWSSGSLPILPSSLVVPSPIASSVATPTSTILVDED
ncbi:hypothetical protein Tco_1495653, partial [Tanacetum coccineum]